MRLRAHGWTRPVLVSCLALLLLLLTGTAVDAASKKKKPPKKAKTKKSPPGVKWNTKEGLEIVAYLPSDRPEIRWSYHHVAELLEAALEDVKHRIKDGKVDLTY